MNLKQLNGYKIEFRLKQALKNPVFCASKGEDKYILKLSSSPTLQQEYLMMNEINHSNILPVKEYFTINNLYCYSMPFAKGGDLHIFMFSLSSNRKFITEHSACFIMKQVFKAIFHLHNTQIIHGDIKPENYLFIDSKRKHLCLADFELSCKIGENKSFIGVDGYKAPEIFEKRPYDEKVDCWGAGVIMFMLLHNVHPFIRVDENGNVPKIWWDEDRIKAGKFAFCNYHRSSEARDLITKLICVDPAKRISAGEALRHPWFNSEHRIAEESCQRIRSVKGEIDSLTGKLKGDNDTLF